MYHMYKVRCPKGHSFQVKLARGINAGRSPQVKRLILDGEFHRITCGLCQEKFHIEKPFSYTDLTKNLFIQVKPRQQYFNWQEASDRLKEKVKKIPAALSPAKNRKVRIVFGLSELREKLLCEEHQIRDNVLELAKVVLLYDHPFLLNRPRLRLSLTEVNKEELLFTASHEHDKRHYHLHLPRKAFEAFRKNEAALKKWLSASTRNNNLLNENSGHYIHFKRLLPHTEALSNLKLFAAKAGKGEKLNPNLPEFKRMLGQLPKGSHLPTEAKQQIKILRAYAKKNQLEKLDSALWEIYFGKEMEDSFWRNEDRKDIDTLWRIFEDLPDNHIEANNRIREVNLGEDNGGGTYDSTNGEIELGSDANLEDFEDTIRHEVGHGVYYRYRKLLQKWLETEFGWQSYPLNESGLDQWVKQMGGWGGITAKERRDVMRCLEQGFDGADDWSRGEIPALKPGHAWLKKECGPRLVFESTPSEWYQHFPKWYRKNGKAFFLNYYYDTLCVVNESTLKLIKKMPDRYAAMSHEEFFAELYALYYDKNDPKRNNIPPPIMSWMKKNLG
jgi:hypothetical protein